MADDTTSRTASVPQPATPPQQATPPDRRPDPPRTSDSYDSKPGNIVVVAVL